MLPHGINIWCYVFRSLLSVFALSIPFLCLKESGIDNRRNSLRYESLIALCAFWNRINIGVIFLLCKETGMQKWARMLVENGKVFVHPSAIMTQTRGESDFRSLPPVTILCCWTLLVLTKHPEDGPGIVQMDNTTARLIIFQWGSASDQEWTLPEHEVFREQTLEVTTTCWWWPSTFAWKESASQNSQDSSLTSKSWKIHCTSHHHGQ